MKLKIVHITQFLGVGGLEKVLELLIDEQLKAGHNVKLIVYDYEQSWVEDFRQKGIVVENSYLKKNGYDFGLLSYLEKKVSGSDVIHTHDINPALYISPLKILFKIKGKKFPRFIHTAHGMDHVYKRPLTKLYETFISRVSDLTVGVGEAVCDVYRSLGLSEKKLRLIENGTRLTEHHLDRKSAKEDLCKEIGLDPAKPLWAAIARIVPLKNQKLILELAKTLPMINFLLVGPSGDDSYWQELQNKKPVNVIMLGSRNDVSKILSAIDIFISASTHEGIPLSVLEAGAQKLPCLLSDIPGHKTLQDHSKDPVAYFFSSNDLESLSLASTFILKDKTSIIGENLYQHIKMNYSSQAMYQKYLDAYLGNHV